MKPTATHQHSTRWWQGIAFRSLATVMLITSLLGGLSSLVIRQMVADNIQQQALRKLNELVDTVDRTASIASYANDAQLAYEVAHGLLRNSEVQRVLIFSGQQEIARAEKSPSNDTTHAPIKRILVSPFKITEAVGEIRIDADWKEIANRVEKNGRYVMILLSAQLLLVILGTAGMVFLIVVRPLKATSDQLHQLDAASGKRLNIPDGHERTELGRLVSDVNELTGKLFDTLDHERELRRKQEIDQRKYHDLFDHAASGIFVADREGCLESFNPAFASLTWLANEDSGRQRHFIDIGWDAPEALLTLLRNSLQTHAAHADDFLLVGHRGDERWLHVAITPLGDGSVQGTITDITARKREELSARRLAITDSLTGFANREGLLRNFDDLGVDDDEGFALVLININGFKHINDVLGLALGDQLLLQVAARIAQNSRTGDFLARIGGDEFVVMVSGTPTREDVTPRVESLRDSLLTPYRINNGPLSSRASIGVAFFPGDGGDLPTLLRSAELALNSARSENGGSSAGVGYQFFDQHLQAAVEHRRRLEDDLRQAVAAAELHLDFQPIVDIRAGRVVGAEALLRWQHAERGLVSPEIFIPLAEELGLIGEVGRFVLDRACLQAAQWRRDELELYVSVNVSARQIPDELTPQQVVDCLQRHHLTPQSVVIEITEGVLMSNLAIAQHWIESVRAAGIRIYLDDFGTGYSSLSYLKRFTMDTVKIDKSFVRDMSADNSDRTLVDAIITMARSLGMDVVAEGVEEADQLDLLREMGCGFVQGYYFSRPLAAADFTQGAARINAMPFAIR